jgi:hypothetical protein
MDRRKFLVVGGSGMSIALAGTVLEGCSAAEWFEIAAQLIPVVLQTVSGLVTANGGLSQSAIATLTVFSTDATTILNDVSADIKTVQTTPGIIPKIDALLAQLKTQAQALLPRFTGNNKVLGWIDAIIADVIDLAGLVPIFSSATASVSVVKMKVSLPAAKNYQVVFQHRLQVAQAL